MPSNFADLGVPADLLAVLSHLGIAAPFPIQEATLPDALAGKDVCGRAPTGSGKSLAFSIPIIVSLQASPRAKGQKGPRAVVLVPTRELAAQVERGLKQLCGERGLRTLAVYGGVSYHHQREAFRRGVDILVACPGRLEDLIAQRALTLANVEIAVIDEADRMADMGFLPAVRRILDQMTSRRQTMLFSATLDGEVDVLVRSYQQNPARHEVESEDDSSGDVTHHFWRVQQHERVALTAAVVREHGPTVVFCRTRHGADRLALRLDAAGIPAAAIHGDRTQAQRDRALTSFRNGKVTALVATDVAARGIHVDSVSCVLHFDLPTDVKDYVHRSGRTGRAGADGTVISMVRPDQVKAANAFGRTLEIDATLVAPTLSPMSNADMAAAAKQLQAKRDAKKDAGPATRGEHTKKGQFSKRTGSDRRSNTSHMKSGAPRSKRPTGKSRAMRSTVVR